MAKKVFRGGVFGFGGVGQGLTRQINYSKWYTEDCKIIGACNRGEAKRRIAEETYGLKAFQDPRDLIKEGLDFGLVTSTTVAHCEHTCVLAEAGIPVFCEKPIALTDEDGRKMLDAVEKADVPTVVNFSLRSHSCNRKIKDMIENEDFGRMMSCSSFVNRGHGFYSEGARHRAVIEPNESGGWIVHHACHQVDLLHWFMGEVDKVSTVSSGTAEGIETIEGLPTEEVVAGRLHFKNGAIGTVFDCAGGVIDEHLSVVGTKRSVGIVTAENGKVIKCKVQGDREWGPPRFIDPLRDFPHQDNLAHFLLDVLRDGKPSRTTLKDAYYSLKVTLAMRDSARQDGAVVKVE